ncbi:MAG: ABC transporter permease [Verrucomicrobiota bacterium]|nr:ABC transporter permease [Verrucomicrobiota bacterium]
MLENVWRLQRAPLGFNAQDVLTAGLTLPDHPGGSPWAREIAFADDLLARTRKLPGVAAASAVYPPPASAAQPSVAFDVVGRTIAKGDWPRARARIVLPEYFQTMKIPLAEGRYFDQRETRTSKPVVIINQTLARQIFPHENPLGHRLRPTIDDTGRRAIEREIIGVVSDVNSNRFEREPSAEIYLPYAQCVSLELALLIRSRDSDGAGLLAQTRTIAAELNKDAFFHDAGTLQEQLDLTLAAPRLNSALLSAFAIVAVVLTAVGIYGVVAYSTAQRRHEIGIRLALGAPKSAIVQLVLHENVPVICASVAAGTFCSALVLWRLGALFPHSLGNALLITALVAFLVSGVALLACWLPARRAAREDPLAAIGLR